MASPIDTIPQTTQDFALYKQLLYDLVVVNKFTKVLETGTDVGDSTRIFSTALQTTNGEIVTIDIKPPVNDWFKDWPIKNIRFIQNDSKQIKLSQEIDLLFLDAHIGGCNSYEQVKTELTNLGVWVKAGGKVVIDDVFHGEFGEGIRKAYEEFAKQYSLPWTVYPQRDGLAILEINYGLPRQQQ